MFFTVALLIAGHLHFTQPTHVATLHYTQGYTVQLQPQTQTVNGIKLQPAHLTIVKTWN